MLTIMALILTPAIVGGAATLEGAGVEVWSGIEASSHRQAIFYPLKDILKSLHRDPLHGEMGTKDRKPVQELWMEQPLDHFAATEVASRAHWSMRYMYNDQFYRPGGPIFIFVGGEWEISEAYLQTGLVYDMARELSGLLYYTEHRFYGRSWPTANSTTLQDLQYLSSRQALADLAYFIRQQKASRVDLQQAPVILTGGSYSASLVTWFTKLYPGVAIACWASSAPLLAKADFYEYLEVVGYALKSVGGNRCYQRINLGVEMMHQRLTSTPTSAQSLLDSLKICSNFDATNALDRAALFNAISNYFAALVQSYSQRIRGTCSHLLTLQGRDDLAAFLEFLSEEFWPSAPTEVSSEWCIDMSYQGSRQLFEEPQSRDRLWFYQTCKEFGWYTTSTSSSNGPETRSSQGHQRHPFGSFVPLSFFEQLCVDLFGMTNAANLLTQHIAQTNDVYGGLQHRFQSVIMTHGQLDPWRAVGQQQGTNVIIIPAHSHTADLGSVNVSDSVSLNLAKLQVTSFVRRHLRMAANKFIA